MSDIHMLVPGHPHEVPVLADYGAFVVSSEAGEPVLPDLDGTGLSRLFQATATTAWVGVVEQLMDVTVHLVATEGPTPLTPAERIVECVLDCPDGRLGIHDGPVDVALRGTVEVAPGRWALRFSFDAGTPDRVTAELWPTTQPAGTTTVHRPADPAPSADPDLLTGAQAWDARYQMRSVMSPTASELGAVTLHLDDDGHLWGFAYDDRAQPLLRRVEPSTARRTLATATVGPRWTPV